MYIKYNRTSTIQQDGKRFSINKNKYDVILFDKGVSRKVPFAKRLYGFELLQRFKKGEVINITFEDLSRVGRTLKDTLATLDLLTDTYQIPIYIRNHQLSSHQPEGPKNPIWKWMIGILGSVYEMERERILEVTKVGRVAYIDNGGKLGEPKGYRESNKPFLSKPKSRQIARLLKRGKSYNDIRGRLNCSAKTIAKVKQLIANE
ncbi:MAG: recombinase family protein [Flavobacteriaceae bacterium]|nr:recombinase family protein [Flavobacteriaceae bacterium]